MISPNSEAKIKPQTAWPILLQNNLLISALIFGVLQFWRPYFFLTDDNLDFRLPNFIEIGKNLLSGRSPFISEHIFGGSYNFLSDPTYFSIHPVYLLTCLLGGTSFRFAIVDIDAFFFFMLATSGFVVLAHYLRREMQLKVSDGWIMFYTLSFTYSVITLTVGASWLDYLGNQSAYPWLALGILQKTWRRGISFVALFSLHQIMGGNFSPLVMTTLLFTLFAFGVSLAHRSVMPLGVWLAGYAVAVFIIFPLLDLTIQGFFASPRNHSITLDEMQKYRVPFDQFPVSVLAGMTLWLKSPHPHTSEIYYLALGSSAAAWCLIPTLANWARWRSLEIVVFAMMACGLFLICRPVWISEIMLRLPILRSIRWPFREFLEFQFFLHLFLLLRPPGISKSSQMFAGIFGTGIMVIPMLLFPVPPTFNQMDVDRKLLFSGGFQRYWDQVNPLIRSSDRYVVIVPLNLYLPDYHAIPFSLLGTFNYSEMVDVTNAGGYSVMAPRYELYVQTAAVYPNGAYLPEQRAALLAERPDLKFITLVSVQPLKITLSSRVGPTIDLTPYVPPGLQAQIDLRANEPDASQ